MIDKAGEALLMAAGMFWQTGWSLVLGFCISSPLQGGDGSVHDRAGRVTHRHG